MAAILARAVTRVVAMPVIPHAVMDMAVIVPPATDVMAVTGAMAAVMVVTAVVTEGILHFVVAVRFCGALTGLPQFVVLYPGRCPGLSCCCTFGAFENRLQYYLT